jgi:hypothetical protein
MFDDGLKAINSGDPLLQEAKKLLQDGKSTDIEGKQAREKLEEARTYYREFLDKHKTPLDRTIGEAYNAGLLHRAITDRDQYAKALANAYLRTQKTPGEKQLLIILPSLLAVGFATRFAKVTARVFV